MSKTKQYQRGVMGITNLARSINPEIGNYVEHYINEMFGISVKISNGAINMTVEIAQTLKLIQIQLTQLELKMFQKVLKNYKP